MVFYFLILQSFLVVVHGRKLDFLSKVQNDEHDAFRQEQLDMHNAHRLDHNVPPMTLDATLTKHAQDFAEHLATINIGLKHCSKIPGCDNYREGENLASLGSFPSTTTANWFKEFYCYDFCSTDRPLTRPGHTDDPVGHYTQVVWKASTLLGIGIATTSDGQKTYVVGRYSPAGNVYGTDQYKNNVLVPNSASAIYQLNCNAVNGGLSDWIGPSACTRTCGGGVTLMKKNCDNPKPSFNGRDCEGEDVKLASLEWCNTQLCDDELSDLDKQCQERGKTADGSLGGEGNRCSLYCRNGAIPLYDGVADLGTRCKYDDNTDGACVKDVCVPMPKYSPPAGQAVTGSWTEVRSSVWYENRFLQVPNGATDLTVTNHNQNTCTIMFTVGVPSGSLKYWCPALGGKASGTVGEVSFTYDTAQAKLTIAAAPPTTSVEELIINCWPGEAGTGDFSWSFTT